MATVISTRLRKATVVKVTLLVYLWKNIKIVMDNRKIKVLEIREIINISTEVRGHNFKPFKLVSVKYPRFISHNLSYNQQKLINLSYRNVIKRGLHLLFI